MTRHRITAISCLCGCVIIGSTARAQLAPAAQVGPQSPAEARAADDITASVEAIVAGDFNGALSAAQEAVAAHSSGPWGYYVRGVALLALKRVDDAMGSFRDAELRFPEADAWGTSVAIWGEANALVEARPCRDAKALYEHYSQIVAARDSAAAAMGRAFADKACPQPAPAPYSMLDPAWEFYRRGDALLRQQRYDEAVASYREAEARLSEANTWGRSIAIWGQAHALVEAGRCTDASPVFLRYAQHVQAHDADAAAMGRRYAERRCVPIRSLLRKLPRRDRDSDLSTSLVPRPSGFDWLSRRAGRAGQGATTRNSGDYFEEEQRSHARPERARTSQIRSVAALGSLN